MEGTLTYIIFFLALVFLLVLVKPGNTTASSTTPTNTALTSATSSPAVTTKSSIEKPSTANVSLSNGIFRLIEFYFFPPMK